MTKHFRVLNRSRGQLNLLPWTAVEKPPPAGYPAEQIELIRLRCGKRVLLRPALPADADLLAAFFTKLSAQTRYLRFLQRLSSPSRQMLHQWSNVNYATDFALVALAGEERNAAVIAISRYSLSRQDAMADLAVTVRDDWQRLGLGRIMLEKAIDAGKRQGIGQFTGVMDAENDVMRKILHDLGYQLNFCFRDGALLVNIST